MIAIAQRRSSDVGPTSEGDAAAGHMIVPFTDSRRRSSCPNAVNNDTHHPSGSRSKTRRRMADAKAPIRRLRKQQTAAEGSISLSRGHDDLIVGFPESKPDSSRRGVLFRKHEARRDTDKNKKQQPEQQALSKSQRSESTSSWRQTSIVWGDDDNAMNAIADDDVSSVESSSDDVPHIRPEKVRLDRCRNWISASLNTSFNRSGELNEPDPSLLSQSFKSLLSIRKTDP